MEDFVFLSTAQSSKDNFSFILSFNRLKLIGESCSKENVYPFEDVSVMYSKKDDQILH